MTRLLIMLISFAAIAPLLAAPVPKHLMPKEPPLYYPTKKGASWVYLEGKAERHFVVTDVGKNKAGDALVVSVAEVVDGERKPYRKVEVSRRGLVWLEIEGVSLGEPLFLLRTPVAVKDEWAFGASEPGGIPGTMRVVRVEEVEVPAGKFTAALVEMEGVERKFRNHLWFAPNVGLVKADYGEGTWVLKSFTPGKE